LLPILYPGSEFANLNSHTLNDFTDLIAKTGFEPAELDALYEQYKSISTAPRPEGGITKNVFEQCLGPIGVESNLVSDRIFAFFDQNQDGIISFPEMAIGMSILCKGSLNDRIKCKSK
jgi:Ca2+-binding EF-hand superfamily protein